MAHPEHMPVRADGAWARQRLLRAALGCFAENGYSKTSTRQIAQAAEVNLGAINYYFGSKAGLYQAVLSMLCEGSDGENQHDSEQLFPASLTAELGIEQVLSGFFQVALQALKQGEVARLAMRVHFREMLDPSGVAPNFTEQQTRSTQQHLCRLLSQHLQASETDEEVRRLALSVHGLVIFHYAAQELLLRLEPALTSTPEAIDALAHSLTGHALAMVAGEAQRRGLT